MPVHNIPPVFDSECKILILGSFPSVKSRETAFYYGHPQNRFFRVLSAVFGCEMPQTVSEKKEMLLNNHVALWDVIASCEIEGSDDSSIKSVIPNDLTPILATAPIRRIFTNGGKATALYKKYLLKQTGIEPISLPSTSPANASYSLTRLIEKWKIITQ